MTKYIFILLTILVPFLGQAQKIQQFVPTDNKLKSKLDTVVQNDALYYLSKSSRVGLSIGVYQNGQTTFYNYGSVRKDKQILPTNKTLYDIGSITKTFVGTLLSQAVKDNKVKIDDDIRLYLDQPYPNLEYQGHPIKLSHLVSHISGLPFLLPDNPKLFQINPDSIPYQVTKTQNEYSKKQFFADLHKVKIDTIPGFNYKYSNAGAQLLKFILEKIYNKPFDDLLKQFISKPLGMKTTSVFKNVNAKYLAKSYNNKGTEMPYTPKMHEGAGGIYSTTSDMLQYLKYHTNEQNEVIALSHKVTLGDIATGAIALNWNIDLTPQNSKKIWQNGGTFGFSTCSVVYPEQNICIILLTNEADREAQKDLGIIADNIFKSINIK